MNIYLIKNKPTPWGDYGDVLVYGFADWDEATDLISISRVGPASPAAYFSQGIFVLTDPVKAELQASGLEGISRLTSLEKTKIVKIDFSQWSHQVSITRYLDLDGEPESIILQGDHDEELARRMPEYWMADTENVITLEIDRSFKPFSPSDSIRWVTLDRSQDIHAGDEYHGLFIDEKAKHWFEQHCPDCFDYFPIKQKS